MSAFFIFRYIFIKLELNIGMISSRQTHFNMSNIVSVSPSKQRVLQNAELVLNVTINFKKLDIAAFIIIMVAILIK